MTLEEKLKEIEARYKEKIRLMHCMSSEELFSCSLLAALRKAMEQRNRVIAQGISLAISAERTFHVNMDSNAEILAILEGGGE